MSLKQRNHLIGEIKKKQKLNQNNVHKSLLDIMSTININVKQGSV
jgi:hypothetical protein